MIRPQSTPLCFTALTVLSAMPALTACGSKESADTPPALANPPLSAASAAPAPGTDAKSRAIYNEGRATVPVSI